MIRIAEIKKLEFVGELGRIRVQFKDTVSSDPASTDVENGVLVLPTGDNVCPSVGVPDRLVVILVMLPD